MQTTNIPKGSESRQLHYANPKTESTEEENNRLLEDFYLPSFG